MNNTCPADYAALQKKYNNIQHKYYTNIDEQKQLANANSKYLPNLLNLQ